MGKASCLMKRKLKQVTDWALRWQLYLDELGRDCPRWSITRRQEWGLFLLEWLFHTATAIWRRKLQHQMWRCPHSHLTTAAKDTGLKQQKVQTLLGSTHEEILELAREVYLGWYQVVSNILLNWCRDQLMSNLHDELYQWLGRDGLCSALQMAPQCRQSAMCSNRSQSRGRTCSHACFSSWAQMPSEANRWEGTAAPQQQRSSTTQANCSPTTGPTWRHTPPRHEGQTPTHSPARHKCSEATSTKELWEASLRGCSQSMHRAGQQEWQWSPSQGGPDVPRLPIGNPPGVFH